MHNTKHSSPIASLAAPATPTTAALLLILLTASTTHANIVKAIYNNATNYNYEIKQVPDFDQVREGVLPNDGTAYCVPTSAINMMAYIATHGLPSVAPGDEEWLDWGDASLYSAASINIAIMAGLMDTDEEEGTFGNGHFNGAKNWILGGGASNKIDVSHHHFSKGFAPSAANAAKLACQGALVNICYGRYEPIGDFNGLLILDRDGGHCVSFVKAKAADDDIQVWVRDPADGGFNNTQSQFKNRKFNAETEVAYIAGQVLLPIEYTRLRNPDGSGNFIRIIDSMLVLKPKNGFAWEPQEKSGPITVTKGIDWSVGAFFQDQLTVADGFFVKETVPSILGDALFVLAEEDEALYLMEVSTLGDQVNELLSLPPTTEAIEVGRDGLVYCAGPDLIECVNPLTDYAVEAQWIPPFDPVAFCFDDSQDWLVGVDPAERKLIIIDPTEDGAPILTANFPEPILLSDDVIIRAARGGRYWVKSSIDPVLYRVQFNPSEPELEVLDMVTIPGCNPTDFDIDEYAHLYVLCDGSVREFVPIVNGPNDIDYVEDPNSAFAGLTTSRFRISRGRSDFIEGVHDAPWWNNIDPSQLDYEGAVFETDCPTDLNGDRFTNSDDLTILLTEFGAGFLGDIDADSDTDSDDLSLLLGAFGDPCDEPTP